jgi:hypothetical protein
MFLSVSIQLLTGLVVLGLFAYYMYYYLTLTKQTRMALDAYHEAHKAVATLPRAFRLVRPSKHLHEALAMQEKRDLNLAVLRNDPEHLEKKEKCARQLLDFLLGGEDGVATKIKPALAFMLDAKTEVYAVALIDGFTTPLQYRIGCVVVEMITNWADLSLSIKPMADTWDECIGWHMEFMDRVTWLRDTIRSLVKDGKPGETVTDAIKEDGGKPLPESVLLKRQPQQQKQESKEVVSTT